MWVEDPRPPGRPLSPRPLGVVANVGAAAASMVAAGVRSLVPAESAPSASCCCKKQVAALRIHRSVRWLRYCRGTVERTVEFIKSVQRAGKQEDVSGL